MVSFLRSIFFTIPSVKANTEKRSRKEISVKAAKTENKKEKAPTESTELSEELFESPLHHKIYSIISTAENPITFDEIFRQTELEISDLNEILLDLEISDMIKAVAGSRYAAKT